jgi:hypothetical protein
MASGGVMVSGSMGVSRPQRVSPSKGGRDRVVESRTYSQPIYIDKVVAHDYDDFVRQMEREIDFKSSPGNLGV